MLMSLTMFLDWSWRLYPAAVLMALGSVQVSRSVWVTITGLRSSAPYPARGLIYYRGFRRTVFGLVIVGLAAAWNWQLNWLLALSLIIGLEETIESSICIMALQHE